MTVLTTKKIPIELKTIPAWTLQAKTIARTFKLNSFLMSIASVRRIAKRAEKFEHHQDIDVWFDKVALTLTTRDASGLTAKDFSMAGQFDKIFANFLEW